jgi:hypothetical protein
MKPLSALLSAFCSTILFGAVSNAQYPTFEEPIQAPAHSEQAGEMDWGLLGAYAFGAAGVVSSVYSHRCARHWKGRATRVESRLDTLERSTAELSQTAKIHDVRIRENEISMGIQRDKPHDLGRETYMHGRRLGFPLTYRRGNFKVAWDCRGTTKNHQMGDAERDLGTAQGGQRRVLWYSSALSPDTGLILGLL